MSTVPFSGLSLTTRPHAPVSVTTDDVRQERSADALGRVTVDVDLGPPNLVDLDDRDPDATSTETRIEVRLEPASPPRSG